MHLVGSSNPGPWHKEKFRAVDLASAREAIAAALESGIYHFIYVSVAHPAPIMADYITARRLGFVTITQMIAALVEAVQRPPTKIRTLTVADIRRAG